MAVIDLGSNSGRVVVLDVDDHGSIEILADGRSPLRLARDVAPTGRLSSEAIDRAIAALRDFEAIASGNGAVRTLAVATEAIREAANGDELLTRIRAQTGIEVRVIGGAEEARLGFLGAVYSLPVEHGTVADIGGGSVELSRFRDRRLRQSFTFPVGALRMSDRYLVSDPPAPGELEALTSAVRKALQEQGVPALTGDERLIGTGGTIRNLAKLDRSGRPYPIPRLDGYVLGKRRVEELLELLSRRRLSRRQVMAGLNADRADSIVGGAVVAVATMETLGADEIIVSGRGLREGLAFDSIGAHLPSPQSVRRSSIAALASRFSSWDRGRAERRAAIAARLLLALEPAAGPSQEERLDHAATVLDVGRSIDFYRRHEHTADILVASDLAGFTHRKLAWLAAIVRQAGDEDMSVRLYRPLLGPDDAEPVARAGAILDIADEIEHRVAPGRRLPVSCEVRGREVHLAAPIFDVARRARLDARFRRVFHRRLVVTSPVGS
jgi:exopolyphosphatase/guanosine-5'-triphosphate,3'-diphosphate pyrophosphatase